MKRLLRWLSRCAYGGWIPHPRVQESSWVADYLGDLWRDAPRSVAATHTLLCVAVAASPLLRGRLKLLGSLPADQRDAHHRWLLGSRIYPIRVAAYVVRANAMVAALRDPEVRASLIPPRHSPPPQTPTVPSDADRLASAPPSTDGRDETDFIVIGSGAGGSTVALALAQAGWRVTVLEEGKYHARPTFQVDLYSAIRRLFRDFGAQAARGRSIFPVLQGRCVGGSTVISGAIVHRLPRDIYNLWDQQAKIGTHLRFEDLEAAGEELERELGVRANLEPLLPSLKISNVLSDMGWRHQAMKRIAPGCLGTGRCLQGCPSGGKLSMERSFVPRVIAAGGVLLAEHTALSIQFDGYRAAGVVARGTNGSSRHIRARRGVIVAAGVVHTPLLLRASGVRLGHVGQHFQCHLGVGTSGLLDQPVSIVEGPPQGIEVTQFDNDKIKLATQLLPPELLLARAGVVGSDLVELFARCDRISAWTASIQSEAEGEVTPTWRGRPRIRFNPTQGDLDRLRRGVALMTELMFAAGATRVFPGMHTNCGPLTDRSQIREILSTPLDARRFDLGVGHLFGTCRMGRSAQDSVVDARFRVHGYADLFVVDGSVLPTNTGVNPQFPILQMARCAGKQIAAETSGR
jgi:choline dehydrogenase-like flavoprotein